MKKFSQILINVVIFFIQAVKFTIKVPKQEIGDWYDDTFDNRNNFS